MDGGRGALDHFGLGAPAFETGASGVALSERIRSPNPITATLVSAPTAVPDTGGQDLTRVGGSPNWVQYPQGAGPCPRCSRHMEFLAQFADPPRWDCWAGDSGLLYVFGCVRCRIAASFVQGA